MLFLRARYYNPGTGTFMSVDPVEGLVGGQAVRWNAYNYVGANPINITDPSGEFWGVGAVFLGALVGGVTGYIAAHEIFTMAKNGDCGCELEDWANDPNTSYYDFVNNAIGAGIGMGAAMGALASLDPVSTAIAGFYMSGASTFAAAMKPGGLNNPCNVAEYILGLGGMATSAMGALSALSSAKAASYSYNRSRYGYSQSRSQPGSESQSRSARTGRLIGSLAECSFDEDTPVATIDGNILIGDLEVGDMVLAYNEETGEIGEYTVTAVMPHMDDNILYLIVDEEMIITTTDHPFYTTDEEWVEAGDLEPGDQIVQADGTPGEVQSSQASIQPQMMWDLTVTDVHTFFVGTGQSLVHNCPPELRPEKSYLGSKKHGLNWKEGYARAKVENTPQGKWGSQDDLKYAGQKAATLKPGEWGDFELPPGSKSEIYYPDGRVEPAKWIRVSNKGNGIFHGFPLAEEEVIMK